MLTAPITATVDIEPHRGARPYDPMIFGQFIEHFHRQIYGGIFEPGSALADAKGFRRDVVEAMRELKVPIVRWPGGCFASAYHWRDGVGPQRRPAFCKAWRVEDPNTFGTDEFIEWCRLIGCEPCICTNAGTGTPEEMSDWVEYCNLESSGWGRQRQANGHAKAHNVKYWSIGNENYGNWEMGAKTIAEWGPYVIESAKMMKRVDPFIKIFAPALPDADWTLALLKAAGWNLDYVSIHGYWDPSNNEDNLSDYPTCVMRSLEPEDRIRATEHIIAAAGYAGRIAIAFDEWNLRGWHHPWGNTQADIDSREKNDINSKYTMADAVFTGGFLNACLRHCDTVKMANLSPVINTRGCLFVHPRGVVKRTTFHVMAMYANLLEANMGSCWTASDPFAHGAKSVPALDAVATCDGARERWRVALVNRHAESELACVVRIESIPLEGSYSATILSGDSPDEFNDVDHPDRVAPREMKLAFTDGGAILPPHSVTILQIG